MPNVRDGENPNPPVPTPPRAIVLLPALVAGILGTGLLYQGATTGSLIDLVVGAPLFGVGLLGAGRPFVWSMALVDAARRRRIRGDRPIEAGSPDKD